MPGRRAPAAEKRRDPTDPSSSKTYTQQQFAQFYGPERGPAMWKKAGGGKGGSKKGGKGGAPPLKAAPGRHMYRVGQKVRATGRLTGDRGQVVNRYSVGKVTAVPGQGVRLERGAVAEVKISGVTFDASADMIEPADAPKKAPMKAPMRAPAPSRRAPPAPRGYAAYSPPRSRKQKQAPQVEKRPDPTMKPGQKGAGKLYTKQQFAQFYGPDMAKKMWVKAGKRAPPAPKSRGGGGGAAAERRPDPTMKPGQKGSGKTYTRAQFDDFYGPDAKKVWIQAGKKGGKKAAPAGPEKRKDPTMKAGQKGANKTYTLKEFTAFYGPAAKKLWAKAGKGAAKPAKAGKKGKKAAPEEKRADPSQESKKTYTLAQFREFYGKDAGGKLWKIAGKRANKAGGKAKSPKAKKGKDAKGKKAKAAPKKEYTFAEVVVNIDKTGAEKIGWSRKEGKQFILGVDEGSPAAKAGVEKGMKIHKIAGKDVKTDEEVTAALAGAGDKFEVTLSKKVEAEKKPYWPEKPVQIHPRSAPKTALGHDFKCEQEGSTLSFDFKADGSILAGEQALTSDGGKVSWGTIGAGGPTDSQKWSLKGGRLKCGDLVLTLGEGGAVEMKAEVEKDKTQAWSFRTGEKPAKKKAAKEAPKSKKGDKRADPTESTGKKYSEADFVKFYGKKNGAKLWKIAGEKAKKAAKKGKGKGKK